MPDESAEWVWILTCRQCARVADFCDVHEPTRPLEKWAALLRPGHGAGKRPAESGRWLTSW